MKVIIARMGDNFGSGSFNLLEKGMFPAGIKCIMRDIILWLNVILHSHL